MQTVRTEIFVYALSHTTAPKCDSTTILLPFREIISVYTVCMSK